MILPKFSLTYTQNYMMPEIASRPSLLDDLNGFLAEQTQGMPFSAAPAAFSQLAMAPGERRYDLLAASNPAPHSGRDVCECRLLWYRSTGV